MLFCQLLLHPLSQTICPCFWVSGRFLLGSTSSTKLTHLGHCHVTLYLPGVSATWHPDRMWAIVSLAAYLAVWVTDASLQKMGVCPSSVNLSLLWSSLSRTSAYTMVRLFWPLLEMWHSYYLSPGVRDVTLVKHALSCFVYWCFCWPLPVLFWIPSTAILSSAESRNVISKRHLPTLKSSTIEHSCMELL